MDLRIAVVSLCAGESRRMGRENKLLLPFDGSPLYTHAWRALSRLSMDGTVLDKIVVSAYSEILEEGKAQGFLPILHPAPKRGVSSSIRLGLCFAEEAEGALFLPADQPFLTEEIFTRIFEAFSSSGKIIVPRVETDVFSPCLFPKRYFGELFSLTGDCGGKKVYRRHREDVCFVDFSEKDRRLFCDMDTKEDIMKARQ